MREASCGATPTLGSTVVREAFGSGFTLHFSDRTYIHISRTFVVRSANGDTETLTASPSGLVTHTSELVSLIGMEVDAVESTDSVITLSFTSGVDLIIS